jgi:hypothetical protein
MPTHVRREAASTPIAPIVEQKWLAVAVLQTSRHPRLAFLNSTSCLPAPARKLLIAADEHQELNRDEACVYGILADLVCGWVGSAAAGIC